MRIPVSTQEMSNRGQIISPGAFRILPPHPPSHRQTQLVPDGSRLSAFGSTVTDRYGRLNFCTDLVALDIVCSWCCWIYKLNFADISKKSVKLVYRNQGSFDKHFLILAARWIEVLRFYSPSTSISAVSGRRKANNGKLCESHFEHSQKLPKL